jgi:cobalt-zinc-cadmium efflux system protein
VHHLHLWNLASDIPTLSAHLVLAAEPSLRDAQRTADDVRAALAERFALTHMTLELECATADGTAAPASPVATSAGQAAAP